MPAGLSIVEPPFLDSHLLARLQFAFTVSLHIVFPVLTIGLASYLAVLEGLWLKTGRAVDLDPCHFWSRGFAVAFGMDVVFGLVMAYRFGTNRGGFSTFAGGVSGPLLADEVLTAFSLEAGFLGVTLFGKRRVGPGLHVMATVMVAIGAPSWRPRLGAAEGLLTLCGWPDRAAETTRHALAVPRLDWLFVIWLASIGTLGVVAMLMRLMMRAVGRT